MDKKAQEDKRIYGVYPGEITDYEYLASCPEQILYMTINHHMLVMLAEDMQAKEEKRTPNFGLKGYTLEYYMAQANRFGTDVIIPEQPNEHVKAGKKYYEWFNKWDRYFKHEITDSELELFRIAVTNNEDITLFRPKDNKVLAYKYNM